MRKHFLSLLFVSALPMSNLLAQEATPLSLQQSIDYALKHNYTVKNSQLDVKIQKAQNNELASAAYPHISGKAELDNFLNPQQQFADLYGFSKVHQIQAFSFALPYSTNFSITGSQLIYDGSVSIALKARNTAMELAKLNSDVTNETVKYNIIKSYSSLVIVRRQYDIIKSSLGFARQIQHDINKIHDAGLAEKIDVERTDVQINNLASDSMKICNLLTVTEQAFKYQLGMDINAPIILTDTSLENYSSESLSLLNEQGDYEHLPEYNLMKTALKLNEFNVKRYQLSALPSLSAFGNLGYNYGTDHFTNLGNFSGYPFYSLIGLQLNVPIFSGMQRINQVREAKLNVQKSKNNIDNMKLTIDFMVAQSRSNLKNAILQVENQKRNLDLANDVLDLAQRKYKEGVGSNQEVTQAQTDQLRAQTNYFSALMDMANANADLKKSLGLLK